MAAKQLDANLDSPEVTEITTAEIRAFIGWMLDTRSDATAKQRHSSLSVFFRWLLAEGEITENPMDRVKAPKVEMKPVPTVTKDVFEDYLRSCEPTFKGKRDAAILWLLWDCGVRLGEITGIKVDDLDTGTERVFVSGKSGHRIVPYTPQTALILNSYLRARATIIMPLLRCCGWVSGAR